ncbi:MAG: acyltransferase family protein [Bacteroidia bacterium]
MINNQIYLPGLNGLRAIAAITVLISHLFFETFGNWGIKGIDLPIFTDGVTLFFVISGFLITYLLLHEIKNTNTINIPKFYIRRILRIWPIYYLYILIVIAVLWWLGQVSDILNDRLFYYIFFTANIPFLSAIGISLIVHYWSIGVEEQFYLFWPWLIKISMKKITIAAFSVLIAWVLLKYGSYILFTNKSIVYKFFNVTRFHCMMIGAIGAIGYYNKNKVFMRFFTNIWSQVISWVIFICLGLFFKYIPALLTAESIAILSLFLIMSQIEGKPKFINLENKFFDFIGKISYGIYVIHPILIFLLSALWLKLNIQLPNWAQYILICTLVPSITIFVAWVSYQNYEKPFLKLKNKFAVVESQNSKTIL